MLKKYILGLYVALSVPMLVAYAAPTLSVTGLSDGTNASVTVSGAAANTPVALYYTNINGTNQSRVIGNTDGNGYYTGTVNWSTLGFSPAYPVYAMVNGGISATVPWPNIAINTSEVLFGQSNPTFTTGQTGTINLYGGGNSYYVASNSNPNVSVSVSGNTLTVSGNQSGSSSVVVCSSTSGNCKTVVVGFSGSGSTSSSGATSSPVLSQSSINVAQGSAGTITLSGGTSPYRVTVLNGTGVSTVLNGNTLTIIGNATGTNTLNICSANATNYNTYSTYCTPMTVNVSGSTSGGGTGSVSTVPLGFTLSLPYATAAKFTLTGGSGSYYLQSNATTPVMASVNGNVLTVSGSGLGSGTVTVCSSSSCMPFSINVGPSIPLTGTGGGYFFDKNFGIGATGQDVTELQTRLKDEGFFMVAPTGYYGPITAQAVSQYQSSHGLPAVGMVGPQTRALLNQ